MIWLAAPFGPVRARLRQVSLNTQVAVVGTATWKFGRLGPFNLGVHGLDGRGNVVPVVDLALRFGVPQSPITNRTCIIIVEVDFGAEPAVMGIIADSVSQVVEFAPSEILAPPSFGTRVKVDFLQGMGKSDKKFSLILNIDKVLSIDEIKVTSPTQRARLERTLKMELSE